MSPPQQPVRAARTIAVENGGGLGNRLRALISGMYLAERFDLALRVGWTPTHSCEAEFHDLFENDFDLFSRPKGASRRAFYESMLDGPIHYYGRSIMRDPELAAVGSIPTRDSDISLKGHIVYDSPIRLKCIDRSTRARLLRRLKIKREILASANAFCLRNGIDKRTHGVHIRRSDHAVKDDDFYIAKMEAILSEDPSARFFLCSDSAETEEEMTQRFPGRVITKPKASYARKRVCEAEWVTRNSDGTNAYNVLRDKQSVVEALTDILILSRTHFTVKYYGAFADVASWWGGSSTENEPLMREALYPFRLGGGFGHWRGGRLMIDPFRLHRRRVLNETAATLFQISDGAHSIERLIASLHAAYPTLPEERIAEDVNQGLADLARHSLIGLSRSKAESAPFIRAGFLDFEPGFDPEHNYFTRMLASRAYVFVAEGNEADVLFRKVHESAPEVETPATTAAPEVETPATTAAPEVETPATTARTTVFVSDGQTTPDFQTYDYAISPHPVAGEFALRHCEIPYREYSAIPCADYTGPALRSSDSAQRFKWTAKRFHEFLFPADVAGLLPEPGGDADAHPTGPSAAPTEARPDAEDGFHICLCSDWDQKDGMLALINSIVRNAETPARLFFHLLVDRDPAYFRQVIESNFSEGFRYEIQAFPTDERHAERMAFLERYMRVDREAPGVKRVDNFMNFARMYLPEIFPDVDTALYLDVDMIVQTDLASLFATNLKSAVVATPHNRNLREMGYHADLGLDPLKKGFNVGFLLMSFDLWRKRELTRTIEKIMIVHKQRLLFKGGNQAVLNLALLDQGLDIDRSWNVWGLGNQADLDPEQLERARVLHWTGTHKPWLEDGWYKHLWERYRISA